MTENLPTPEDKIRRLEAFRKAVLKWDDSYDEDRDFRDGLRAVINREIRWVRQQVIEAHCFKLVNVIPPAVVGGPVMRDGDPFDLLFTQPYGLNATSQVVDMIDQTIGVLKNPTVASSVPPEEPEIEVSIQKGYAFVAMAIDPDLPGLVDTLDSIKEAANQLGIQAERVDEDLSGNRITDVILESIARAEFVIVDLTNSRPNVYYEAGYAHGQGKKVIFVAEKGTDVEFDLRDYPIIFFDSQRQLKERLEERLRALADQGRS